MLPQGFVIASAELLRLQMPLLLLQQQTAVEVAAKSPAAATVRKEGRQGDTKATRTFLNRSNMGSLNQQRRNEPMLGKGLECKEGEVRERGVRGVGGQRKEESREARGNGKKRNLEQDI